VSDHGKVTRCIVNGWGLKIGSYPRDRYVGKLSMEEWKIVLIALTCFPGPGVVCIRNVLGTTRLCTG
jgi:hypothetical protein